MNIYSGIEAVIQVSAPTRISNMVSVAKRNNYTRDQAPHRLNANCWCICAPLWVLRFFACTVSVAVAAAVAVVSSYSWLFCVLGDCIGPFVIRSVAIFGLFFPLYTCLQKSFRYLILHINTHFIGVWNCRKRRAHSILYLFYIIPFWQAIFCYFALISFCASVTAAAAAAAFFHTKWYW